MAALGEQVAQIMQGLLAVHGVQIVQEEAVQEELVMGTV